MAGRVWKFGDDVNTDVLAPGIYIKLPLEDLASHCLEAVEPNFASYVQDGDIVVGGVNFGMGSSREQAAQVLKALGVAAVIAPSFGGIFYRNAFNLGLPAIVSNEIDQIAAEQELKIVLKTGVIENITTGKQLAGEAVPENLMDLVEAGGLVPYLEQKLNKKG
ncbi:MAG: 3-isopropylmalate dehydratase [Rhodospirillaceae bacterium]|jgi:3-isopropylmalate/(R)-2-methylmalate dehydratase small subunit|nr:3-isopropylmalate dehydratase [Rhodospirillaceae bacterium]MBT4938719.1 3-isopropylmalate dehydratase [Rhodospirillaceae bacterium]MBT7268833.1 3-isopropylmalate dehydratase [Rhodospirillaceae bacterium]